MPTTASYFSFLLAALTIIPALFIVLYDLFEIN